MNNNQILNKYQRSKYDDSDDSIFYSSPRFVHHLDKGFRNKLTNLYRDKIPNDSVILDLMSSWVSHLPDIKYKKVIGHGLNQEELDNNPKLDTFWVQNLNKNQLLPLEEKSIDFCLIVAGWQYLQYPELVSSEILRIIKPNGRLIISFTNRAFWNKSPNIWVDSNEDERVFYISKILRANGWCIDEIISDNKSSEQKFLSFLSKNSDPFYSIISKPNF